MASNAIIGSVWVIRKVPRVKGKYMQIMQQLIIHDSRPSVPRYVKTFKYGGASASLEGSQQDTTQRLGVHVSENSGVLCVVAKLHVSVFPHT